MRTSRLPGTVLRSSGECPCTSALGLFTRRYSAGSSKRSPLSKLTASVAPPRRSLSSVGQGDMGDRRGFDCQVPAARPDAARQGKYEAHHALVEGGDSPI